MDVCWQTRGSLMRNRATGAVQKGTKRTPKYSTDDDRYPGGLMGRGRDKGWGGGVRQWHKIGGKISIVSV